MLWRHASEFRQIRLTDERLQNEIETARLQFEEVKQSKTVWNGFRKFSVREKVFECHDTFSLYLTPHDGKPLPPFEPGQFLTLRLNIPGQPRRIIRCYSLSDSPFHPDCYRLTIKKAPPPRDQPEAPPGVASSFICDSVNEGDILDVKAPAGKFVLDMKREFPVVLLSGGVGITPMLSMLNALVESGSKREIWFVYGARNGTEHIQKEHLIRVAEQHRNVRLHICYSRPNKEDSKDVDFHHAERVSVDLLKRLLPSANYKFFICGPGQFIKSLADGLKEWGAPPADVMFEAFGSETVKKAAPAAPKGAGGKSIPVRFERSGAACSWNAEVGSLLDLAEANGVSITAGCRAGDCESCLVAVKSGEIEYLNEPGCEVEKGSCLACIARPKSDLVIDA